MNSTLAPCSLHLRAPSLLHIPSLKTRNRHLTSFPPFKPIQASSNRAQNETSKTPILQALKTITKAAILIGLSASFASRFSVLPAKADSSATVTEQTLTLHEEEEAVAEKHQSKRPTEQPPPLAQFLESSSEAVESLRSLLLEKLQNGEDEEAVNILSRLVAAQPLVTEWKFLLARLYNEIGRTQDARYMFEEILQMNPLSFEALFENALLMDRCGEGDAVIRRLQEALDIAEEENKVKEARDVRFIMAQIQFLQKDVEGALISYRELSKEDPNDFRPYFCRGMIYSLLDRNEEAREQFNKYRELSPKKFEVEGYLRTPLSRMKLFGSNGEK